MLLKKAMEPQELTHNLHPHPLGKFLQRPGLAGACVTLVMPPVQITQNLRSKVKGWPRPSKKRLSGKMDKGKEEGFFPSTLNRFSLSA